MSSRINDRLPADIRAYFAASGGGKTHNMLQDCKHDKRVLAFDPTGALSAQGFTGIQDFRQYAKAVRNSGVVRLAFEAGGSANFALWCELMMAQADARRPTTVVVDELGGVTTPSKAPEHWHNVISLGRKYGLKIRAGAQRAPEIDKTLIGNKTQLWIGFQSRAADAEYLARETDIPVEEIKALRPTPHYDAIVFRGRDNYSIKRR
ncbi:hypothetical protein ABMA57_07525 [Saccharospirillum sp. HFRX-1]|uniref:hypothetical protein n=1 Tax=unclassified Saccharospirillum TaxID=2633430 RepID=UPI003712823E